jgi:chemotaxis protein MotB
MTSARPTRRRRRPAAEQIHGNHERWLLTYADMITLLMVLFIVLFAISVVDKKKFAELADGLAHQFGGSAKVLPTGTGVLDGGRTTNPDRGQLANSPTLPIAAIHQSQPDHSGDGESTVTSPQSKARQQLLEQEKEALAEAKRQIEAALQAKGLQSSVSFAVTSRGLVVSIVTDQVLFDTGQAELKPVGKQVLDAIAPALRQLPNDISIEGHTDDVPISGPPFASNWELSAVRATTVLRYLVDADGLQPARMSATGYADTKPVVPNDSAAHRAQNRRVEVVVLSSLLSTTGDS